MTIQLLEGIERRWEPVVQPIGSRVANAGCPDVRDSFGSESFVCGRVDRLPESAWTAAAARELQRFQRDRPEDPRIKRALLFWELLWSRNEIEREGVVEGFIRLKNAAAESPGSLSDATFVLQLTASLDARPANWLRALELLDEATAHRAEPETELSRAFALMALGLWTDARAAWETLGQRGGEWGEIAKAYSSALPQPLRVASAPVAEREVGERALGTWAVKSLRGEGAKATASLAQARIVGNARMESGDYLLAEAVTRAAEAAANPGSRASRWLFSGHAAFARARGSEPYAQCGAGLERAERELGFGNTPFLYWARLDRAICSYFEKDFSRAAGALASIDAAVEGRNYPSLKARVAWIRGLLRMVEGRFAEADHSLRDAGDAFERLGEEEHVIYLHSLRAKNYELSGMAERAWEERLPALLGRDRVSDPERVYTIVEEAAQALSRQERPSARYFLAEQVRAAELAAASGGDSDLVAYALLDRARANRIAGRSEEALEDLNAADHSVESLPEAQESRMRLRLESGLERALSDPRASLEVQLRSFDEALKFLGGAPETEGDQTEVLRLLVERADLELAAGRTQQAARTLGHGLREVSRRRAEFPEPEQAAQFLAWVDRLFESATRLELDGLGATEEALRLVELRAGSETASRLSGRAAADAARVAAERLGATILRYGHLPDRVLVWVIDARGIRLEVKPLPVQALREQIVRFRFAIARRDSAAIEVLGRELGRSVWPVGLEGLEPDHPLIIVPDEAVVDLPFELLAPGSTGDLLVELHSLSYAPTLAILGRTGEQHLKGGGRELAPKALFVADPEFPPDLFPQLPRLPFARAGVTKLSSNYQEPEILMGSAATRAAVLAALARASIVHFSSHGLADPRRPDLGGVVLAASPATSSPINALLRGKDLERLKLDRLDVVVLAACSTAFGTFPETGQVAGLAGSFLARGAHRVVAARWSIEDVETEVFFETFHRELSSGATAEAALRMAQREALLDPARRVPGTAGWAAFQVYRDGLSN